MRRQLAKDPFRRRPRCPRAGRLPAVLAFALVCVFVGGIALGGGDWNDEGIDWIPYADAVPTAKKSGKPICLVFYTDWCRHCKVYSGVFHDAKVVEMSRSFVMVRVDKDANRDLSEKYAPDGQYIPRTYFLSTDGRLDETIHAPRESFKYFYVKDDPASLLAGMERALAKLK